MEQPTISKKLESADEMQSIDLNTDRKDPAPNHGPAPDPKPDSGALKPGDKGNADTSATRSDPSTVGLKERHDGEEENSADSAAEGLKSKKSVRWSQELVVESPVPREADRGSGNPYVDYPPATAPADSSSSFNFIETMGTVKDVLGKWRKKVGEATRKAEDLAGNTWQHLKTSPSLTDAALGRIAQGTKVLAEGGYEKIFQHSFETVPEEQLRNSFACYLSTSAGPVMGVLYISTAKLAFCSDNPLSYQSGDKTEWSYYKVVIPLHQLKAINPSTSRTNLAEKYIQVISVDNHEFWFMGFLKYGTAVECLQQALQAHEEQMA